jgi:hypothetical protein
MTTQFRCLDTGTPLTVARHKFRRVERIDEYPDTSWLHDASGRERLDAFGEGTWHLMGIQASAIVLIPLGAYRGARSGRANALRMFCGLARAMGRCGSLSGIAARAFAMS